MSVALIPMAAELGWSTADRGLVSSAFFWGYAATQIPAGYVAVRIGGAKVLLAGVALWSLGALRSAPSLRCLGHAPSLLLVVAWCFFHARLAAARSAIAEQTRSVFCFTRRWEGNLSRLS